MRAIRLCGPLALLLLLTGCSPSGQGGGADSGAIVQQTEQLPAPQVGFEANVAEYRIGPLDLLEVSVFQVPDLGRTVRVSANGEIALPLIGTVKAGGRTVAELESDIASLLGAKYLQSPQVTVFVQESTSQRVTVDGAVVEPGIVDLTGQTSLLQAIAIAGGLADGADPRGIVVFRNVGNQRMAAKFDLAAIRSGTAEDPIVYGGDIVVVDRSRIRSALSSIRDSLPVFSIFSPLAAM
jgi:polysaccharide export outer membrane protein